MNIKNNSIYKLIYVIPIVLYSQTVFSKVDETAVTNAAEQFLVSNNSNGCLINTQNDRDMYNALAWEKPDGKAGIILLNFQQGLGQCRIGFPGQCIDVTFDEVTPPQYSALCRAVVTASPNPPIFAAG